MGIIPYLLKNNKIKIKKYSIGFLLLLLFLQHKLAYAQEEESAAVFLEEYSDDFQEHFFEGLKEKGIQNYGRAMHQFLECKKIDSLNTTVDFELGTTSILNRDYPTAEFYLLAAVNAIPENYWFLNSLVEVTKRMGKPVSSIENQIPFKNDSLKLNLATILYKIGHYKTATSYLSQVKKSTTKAELSKKLSNAILAREAKLKALTAVADVVKKENPLDAYKTQLDKLMLEGNANSVKGISEEAVTQYPAQPYFYYTSGWAKNKLGEHKEAVLVLEMALDYLIDDLVLQNNIYSQLAIAYKAMGNTKKANEYTNKIKKGL